MTGTGAMHLRLVGGSDKVAPMTTTLWHGLELEFTVERLDGGPGLRAGAAVADLRLVRVASEADFRDEFPTGTPAEAFASNLAAIEADILCDLEDRAGEAQDGEGWAE